MVPMSADPLESAWLSLLEGWDDEGKHRAFVALGLSLDRLPDVAKHYRDLRDDPERGERARKGTEAVLAAAVALLSPNERKPAPPRGIWVVPLLLAGIVAMASITVAKVTHTARFASPVVLLGEAALVFLLPWPRMLGTRRDD